MISKGKEIETLLKKLPSKGRFRFFLLFVFVSFSFWISTKLSNTYTVEQTFSINWIDIPPGIIITDKLYTLNATIKASGIEVLLYRLFKNELDISLKDVNFNSSKGVVNTERQNFFVQQQLFNNTILNQINPIILNISFSHLDKKIVPILPKIEFSLVPGFLLDSPIISKPDSVLIRGPKILLDSINYLETQFYFYKDIFKPFISKVKLNNIPKIQLPIDEVEISLSVSRYSEREFMVPIGVLNLPINKKVKLFPPLAKVRVTLPISILSTVKDSDFNLVVDYNDTKIYQKSELELMIKNQPPAIKQIIIEPKHVNYLIKK